MTHRKVLFTALALLLLSGCGSLPLPSFSKPTATPLPPTLTLVPASTDTPIPTLTPSPTITVTPSPTIFLTPTETPENFVLAESGYDIADVRLSYPREDIVMVAFKYRLDENSGATKASIMLELPRRCQDAQYGLYYRAEEAVGEGQFTFKMTLEGECSVENFEIAVWPEFEDGSSAADFAYREIIKQSFSVVRNFPTLNKDMFSVGKFEYQSTGEWSGVLSFEYSINEAIPIPPEEYYFSISGRGNDDCDFGANGPILTQHAGVYEIPINLPEAIHPWQNQNCLDAYTSHSYGTVYFYLVDRLADSSSVDFRTLNFPIKIWRTP